MHKQEQKAVRRQNVFDNKIELSSATAAPARRSRRIDALKSASTIGSARSSGKRVNKDLSLPVKKEDMQGKPGLPEESVKPAYKNKSRAPRLLFGILTVLLFLGLTGFLGYRFVRTEQIAVEGNSVVDAAHIISLSGIQTGMHIFNIDKKLAKEGIESDPYLIYHGIRYTFPDKITIVVEERKAAACFDFFNAYVIIDADGLILGHQETGSQPALPLIQGINVQEFALGAKIRTDDTAKQSGMVELLDVVGEYDLTTQVKEINFTDKNAITMILTDGTNVKLGQTGQFEEKMEWLYNILAILKEKGFSGGTIDITSVEAPSYVPPISQNPQENGQN